MQVAEVEMPEVADTPIRKSARRLRWFKETLHRQADALQMQTGVAFNIDDAIVRRLFLRWLALLETQRPNQDSQREDYVNFAAGLMLRELIRSKPASVAALPANADLSNPAFYWPEGYLYVALCLNIRAAVFEQDFNVKRQISPKMDDMRAWWSFKENVETEDPNLAIGFFDLFAGVEPNWQSPSIFSARRSEQITSRYFTKQPTNVVQNN